MDKKDYNQCYYSPTEKHDLCTHYNFIREEGTPNCADYEATKMKIKILNEDLKRLEEFRERRIGGSVR